MHLAEIEWKKSDLNFRQSSSTALMVFQTVRLESSSTGSFFLSVTAKPDCFVTQVDSVFGSDGLAEQRC